MSKKHKNVCRTLDYIAHALIVISEITGCLSISAFLSLIGTPIELASCTVRLKIFVVPTGTKKYKSMNKKRK